MNPIFDEAMHLPRYIGKVLSVIECGIEDDIKRARMTRRMIYGDEENDL